jgi:hypothetical protein
MVDNMLFIMILLGIALSFLYIRGALKSRKVRGMGRRGI